ncbi:EamA family transporter RarD [Alkalicoccus chagannorensis]|uniref:EamA family transporter RarD n=1 Tax=Alkalicoccus chagannorensis TaxID=427072 RepID=UPI000414FD73|nr:EamA family transporter RarD [Alkalicoccus chagannorensis]
MQNDYYRQGIFLGIGAYVVWGTLPIYWKLLDHIAAVDILAHRIVWSCLFMLLLLAAWRKMDAFREDLRYLREHPKIIAGIFLSAGLISCNWLLFIWAVSAERIVEVSLGYYINPLINVVLGVLVFKESLSVRQKSAVALAAFGVLLMTAASGVFPYIALALALSFGFYGLVKKQTKIASLTGLTIETMLLLPPALLYFTVYGGGTSFMESSPMTMMLLAGTGAATAVPLLLFGSAAQKIPLSVLGFLQFIAPTMMLVLGTLVYGEPFSWIDGAAFLCIWTALIIYSRRSREQG